MRHAESMQEEFESIVPSLPTLMSPPPRCVRGQLRESIDAQAPPSFADSVSGGEKSLRGESIVPELPTSFD